MTPEAFAKIQSRRGFLERTAGGMGMVALWHLLAAKDVQPTPRRT